MRHLKKWFAGVAAGICFLTGMLESAGAADITSGSFPQTKTIQYIGEHDSGTLSRSYNIDIDSDGEKETIVRYLTDDTALAGDGIHTLYDVYDNGNKQTYVNHISSYGKEYHIIQDNNTGEVYWGCIWDSDMNGGITRILPEEKEILVFNDSEFENAPYKRKDYEAYLENIIFLEQTAYSKGDADGDGKITVEDAVAILTTYAKRAAGWTVSMPYYQESAADVDSDGQIIVEDAVYTLTYYAQQAAGLSPSWADLQIEVPYDCPEMTACEAGDYGGEYSTLMGTFFYDMDQDGRKETIAKYGMSNSRQPFFYRVYESETSYTDYTGTMMWATGAGYTTMVCDYNINKIYLAEIDYHGSNSGQGLTLNRYDGISIAEYHTYNTFMNGELVYNTEKVFTINGQNVSCEDVLQYFNHIAILDTDNRDLENWLKEGLNSVDSIINKP